MIRRALQPPLGTVLGAVGGVYSIELPGGEHVEAVLRGRLKRIERPSDRVVAGDEVRLAWQDERCVIEAVQPRRSQLVRRAPGPGRHRPKVIVANVDRVVIVFAATRPDPNPRTLDRLLVLTEASELAALIVLNKLDLADAATVTRFLAPYRAAGYRTLPTSAETGRGVAELRATLSEGRSVLTGPSGVGKSHLLNAVQPGLDLRTGALSEAVAKGRHTTVAARLIRLECGGYVADTPGLREVGMWGVEPHQLDHCFPEFRPLLGRCRFDDCSHTHEPDCAVRDALDAGAISAARYESYAALHAEAAG
ncbi:MAG: ribosome small subunit-dependent GTPase A [Gemmatimonadetes bacterium]|nr:ribosome small subunit-dependent GTPase A [Gemmatimonadota bacterium]